MNGKLQFDVGLKCQMKEPKKQKGKKKLIKRLRNHYRLVILNIDTFEERFSLLLTPLNVIVISGISLVSILALTFFLLAYTPLRFYLPGYAEEVLVKKMAVSAALKADSMEVALRQRDAYYQSIQNVIEGRVSQAEPDTSPEATTKVKPVEYKRSQEDSLLRKEIEAEDLVNLNPNFNRDSKSSYILFPPVKGVVTESFSAQRSHFGVDIAAPKDASIQAVDDGTVILASYTAETGHIIQVQHDNELISIYKHNSVLLKKQGDKVRAGEAIAIIGETGEFSSGPHLHFEMWRNGVALNPESFFSFE